MYSRGPRLLDLVVVNLLLVAAVAGCGGGSSGAGVTDGAAADVASDLPPAIDAGRPDADTDAGTPASDGGTDSVYGGDVTGPNDGATMSDVPTDVPINDDAAAPVDGPVDAPADAPPAAPDGGPIPGTVVDGLSVLWPPHGLALNATKLPVRIIAAGIEAAPGSTFSFNGKAISGRNAAILTSVAITFDGTLVETRDVSGCAQPVVETVVDIGSASAGQHTLTVTVGASGLSPTSASVTVNVDRALPALEAGALERPLAPRAIQCLRVNTPTLAKPRSFSGELELPPGATLDPARDGLVVVVGDHIAELAPSALTCTAQGCTFGASSPLVSGALMPKGSGGRLWTFSLDADSTVSDQVPPVLYLASRGLWAGADLATRERFAAPRPTLDVAGAKSLSIGPGGGAISVYNSQRILVTLSVPAGALTRATTITMTPLADAPAFAGSAPAVVGVKLEPEGLVLAQPASVIFSLGAAGMGTAPFKPVFLATSPLTATPLLADRNSTTGELTATLFHFSQPTVPTVPPPQVIAALKERVATAISQPGDLDLLDISFVLAAVRSLQIYGFDADLDLEALTNKIAASARSYVAKNCAADIANANEARAAFYYALDARLQLLGASPVPEIKKCADDIHGRLCGGQRCAQGQTCVDGACCRVRACGPDSELNYPCGGGPYSNCGRTVVCGACPPPKPTTCTLPAGYCDNSNSSDSPKLCGSHVYNCSDPLPDITVDCGGCPAGYGCDMFFGAGTGTCKRCPDCSIYSSYQLKCGANETYCGVISCAPGGPCGN